MSSQTITTSPPPVELTQPDWDCPSPPSDLIFDDGEPLESHRHRIAMNVLIESIGEVLSSRLQAQQDPDFFVGGNMFVYFSRQQGMNRDFRGPDVFVALEVDGTKDRQGWVTWEENRQGWVTWEENGQYPNVIIELTSPSTAEVDRVLKKELYQKTFRTPITLFLIHLTHNPCKGGI
jgi:Uma2 family endonuclease